MKNFKLGLVALLSIVFSKISFSQGPTVNGNVMSFANIALYESYIENQSLWPGLRIIAQQSSALTTMAEAQPVIDEEVDTLYDEFLREVLNTDKIVQIGSYLIKVDMESDRGLLISSSAPGAYSDLTSNNLSASGMMVLDGEEENALDLLEALESKSVEPADYQSFLNANRPCPGANRKKDIRGEDWDEELTVQCGNGLPGIIYYVKERLAYRKSIISFTIRARLRSLYRCYVGGSPIFPSGFSEVDIKLNGTIKYRKRCGTEVNEQVTVEEGYYGGGNGVHIWTPYHSGRSLSHYDCTAAFEIRHAVDRTPNPPPYHKLVPLHIMWGY